VCASAFRLGIGDYLSKPVEETELVASVRRLVQGRRARPTPAAASAPAFAPEATIEVRLKWVARNIQDRYAERLTLRELARKAHMSRFTLSRRFSAHFQVSIRAYIAQVRVAHAIQLLGRPGMSITEIGQEIGFYDLPRFDKVFRRIVGMSPSAYRRPAAGATKGKLAGT
jgi:AraC-like DNA-binding protein